MTYADNGISKISLLKSMISMVVVCLLSAVPLQARDWESIKQSGVLKVSLRENSSLNYSSTNTNHGFNYEMAQDFAKSHNLKMELTITKAFSDFWERDGEILLKNHKIETPGIYDRVDIVADILTVTKKREKLIKMSPYIDNVELFFGGHDLKISSYKDLIGKRVITWEIMVFSKIVKSQLEKQNIPYKITFVYEKDRKLVLPKGYELDKSVVNLYLFPAGEKTTGKMLYHFIVNDYADVGIRDGLKVMLNLYSNSYYRENLKPLMPAQKQMSQLGWGSDKKSIILNKKIEEFLDSDKKNGNFSHRLQKYIGMSLDEYNQLLNMM